MTLFAVLNCLYLLPQLLLADPALDPSTGDAKYIKTDGDFILGGLFPLHEKGGEGRICGMINKDRGVQRAEAMMYAVDRINKDNKLLPGLTLGVHILDTCLRDTFALDKTLEFLRPHMSTINHNAEFQCSDGKRPRLVSQPSKPIAGVIGASASPVSIMVANILRLFKVPQISYSSTGIELSDKSRFYYFSRVVPPDDFQALAMVEIVKAMGWTYVSTVADEGNYGEKGIAEFESKAEDANICIARSIKIPRETRADTYKRVITDLESHDKAKVVVLFVSEDNCRRLLAASMEKNATSKFYWLASDNWGAKRAPVRNQEWAAEGTVTVLPQRTPMPAFDEYFTRLNPQNNSRNPWFTEFWESKFYCEFNKTRRKCTGREKIGAGSDYTQEGYVPFVIDAVYAMAHALHNMYFNVCGKSIPRGTLCKEMIPPIDGDILLSHIRNVSFKSITEHMVRFNEDGDAIGRYTIFQFQKISASEYDYVPIGNWSDMRLQMDVNKTRWKDSSVEIPRSVCSEPCPPGQVRSSKGSAAACCWVCIRCDDWAIIVDDNTCQECPNGSYPDKESRSRCEPLPVLYMSLTSAWAIIPLVFSSLGIVLVAIVFAVFIKFNATPVIMASGRELCYVIQLGLVLCYFMTFVMVSRPTVITCAIMRLGLGVSLSLCYAAIFTKTNRISRIFNRGLKAMIKRPSYTSPRSQIVICLCLVTVQVLATITWLGMELPDAILTYPDRQTVVLQCKDSNLSIVLSLVYNMVLVAMCTVYAFKTRNIPENFNEAKYIAFTMYSSCIVWLAFVPIYYGANRNDFRIQITALCLCISISATVTLVCLFLPKVYIVLFQPHKNTRHSAKTTVAGPGGRAFFGQKNGDALSPTGLAMLIARAPPRKDTDGATLAECETLQPSGDAEMSCPDDTCIVNESAI